MVRQELIDRMNTLKQTPPLERIAAIRDQLSAAGDEAQQIRRLPEWANRVMVDAGLYRFAMPAELAGEDLRARQQIEILEAASAIDGSIGWLVQINSEINALVLRQMEPSWAHQIADDWDMLVCSGLGTPNGPFPGRKARREGDGWRLTYQGAFASGSYNATWNLVLNPAAEVIDENTGEPANASWMIPKGEFEVIDTWDMAGLRGSGSHDVRITDGYVPPEHCLPMSALASTKFWENPTLRNPTQVPYNKAGVALGIARGAIDCFIDLAMVKTPWMSGSMLKDMPDAWIRLGEMEATLQAARAFVMETQDKIEANLGPLHGGREQPEWPLIRLGLLSATYAAQTSRHVVDIIHNTAGTTASRTGHPLERKLRDAHQAAAHGGVSWRHIGLLGKTFLGYDPPPAYSNVTRA
jgi:alkylation response protein AidB-like acyl-CoA dehydrogenase